ncbi:MAG: cytochrome c biogenesis protein CcdA [Vulcanimicrobiaceae bacterium]
MNIGYPGAFFAGMLSFASPCVLPLVPAYLSFLAGVSFADVSAPDRSPQNARRVMSAALSFVCGFATVFTVLGATATALGHFLSAHLAILDVASGVLIVLFGLHYTGLLRVRYFDLEKRIHSQRVAAGIVGAYLIGLSFGFGWTPCVGPVLATILSFAANESSVWKGAILLAVYSAGIGVPFLLAAAFVEPFMRVATSLKRRMRWLEMSMGTMMIVTGVLIIGGSLSYVSGWILQHAPALGRVG